MTPLDVQRYIEELNRIWPYLVCDPPHPSNIWLADNTYWPYDNIKGIQEFLSETFFDRYKWIQELFDCDNFAQLAFAYEVQERYKQMEKRKLSKDQWYQRALAEVWGTKFRGEPSNHAIGGAIAREGSGYVVVLWEPQTDAFWKADPANDAVYYWRG